MLPLPAGPSVSRGFRKWGFFQRPFFPVSICDTNLDDSDSEHARTKRLLSPGLNPPL